MFRFFRKKTSGRGDERLLESTPVHPIADNKKDFLYVKYDSAEQKLKEVLAGWSLMKVRFVRKIDSYEVKMKKEQEKLRKEKERLHNLYNKKIEEIEKRSLDLLQKYKSTKEEGYSRVDSPKSSNEKVEGKVEDDSTVKIEDSSETGENQEKEEEEVANSEKEMIVESNEQNEEEEGEEEEVLDENEKDEESGEIAEEEEEEEEEEENEEIPENVTMKKKKDSESSPPLVLDMESIKKAEQQRQEITKRMKEENERLVTEAEEYRQKYSEVVGKMEKLEVVHTELIKEKEEMETTFETKVKELISSKENLEKEMASIVKSSKIRGEKDNINNGPFLPSTSTSPVMTRSSKPDNDAASDENDIIREEKHTQTTISGEERELGNQDERVDLTKYKLVVETEEKTVQSEETFGGEQTHTEEKKEVGIDIGVNTDLPIPSEPTTTTTEKSQQQQQQQQQQQHGDEIIESPWGTVLEEVSKKKEGEEESQKESSSSSSSSSSVPATSKEIENLRTQRENQEEENKTLRNDLIEKTREIEIFEQKVKDLETELSEIRVKMKGVVEEHEKYQNEQNELNEQHQRDLERQKKILEEHRNEMDSKPEVPIEVQMELEDLKSKIVEKDKLIEDVKSQVTKYTDQVGTFKKEKIEIEGQIELVKGQKSEIEEKLKLTQEDLEKRNEELKMANEKLKALETEKACLEDSMKQSSSELLKKQEELSLEVVALTHETTKLKKLGEDYQAQITKLEGSQQRLGLKLKETERTRDKSLEQNKVYEHQVVTLTKEKDELATKFNEFHLHSEKMKDNLEKMKEKCDKSNEMNQKLVKSMKNLEANTERYKDLLEKSEIRRKKLHNIIEDSKGKIRVYMRCRPMSRTESERGCSNVINFVSPFAIAVNDTSRNTVRNYDFTKSFGPTSTQVEVYGDTKDLVLSAVDGYNVCIFAYGQTGSGKTFTIAGEKPDHIGIVDRGIEDIFKTIKKKKRMYRFQVECYMVEVYLDKLYDLFSPRKAQKNIKYDIKKNVLGQVVVTNVVRKRVKSAEECLRTYEAGLKNRHTRSTDMNESSSRSHLIFSVLIIANNPVKKTTTYGKLSLVDLAGSERIKKTNITDAIGLKEGMAINKSLSALGNVINALSLKKKFVPYRNDKLTLLLSDSIGGTAKTLMFVCISPADYNVEETCNSLLYANRAKSIVNKVEQQNETSLNKKYRMQIERLREALLQKCENSEEYDGIIEGILSSLSAKRGGGKQGEEEEEQQQQQGGGGRERGKVPTLKIEVASSRGSKTPQPRRTTKPRVLRTPRSKTPRK